MKMRIIIAVSIVAMLATVAMTGCTKAGDGSSSQTQSSSQAPSSEAPKKAVAGQLEDVYDAVYKATFPEEGPAMEPITDMAQIKEFTGVDLTSDIAQNVIYAMPMMNTQFQKFFGVEAVEGKEGEVEKLLKDYQTKVIADQEAFPYVDDTVEKAKAAQIVVVDNYVFYICMADTASLVENDVVTQDKVDAATKALADAAKSAVKLA